MPGQIKNSMIKNKPINKILSSSGLALPHYLLIAGIVAVLLSIAAQGYIHHIWDVRMTFDQEEVDEALKLGANQYLSDGRTGAVTYYYDAAEKAMTDREGMKRIVGYGRSRAAQNKHQETGAVGIPNRGGKDGAQFLAISFDAAGTNETARWQGQTLRYYDWTIMTKSERDGLTDAEFDMIQASAPADVRLNRKSAY